MKLLRTLIQSVLDWARDLLLDWSGRCAEEYVGKQIKRRARKKNRSRKKENTS
jgi:hypothetical protein